MKCDTCQQDVPLVMRVVVAKGYNRILARPVYNCPACFEKKEQTKPYLESSGRSPSAGAEPSSPSRARQPGAAPKAPD